MVVSISETVTLYYHILLISTYWYLLSFGSSLFLGYIMSLFQVQRLNSVKRNGKMNMDGRRYGFRTKWLWPM